MWHDNGYVELWELSANVWLNLRPTPQEETQVPYCLEGQEPETDNSETCQRTKYKIHFKENQ